MFILFTFSACKIGDKFSIPHKIPTRTGTMINSPYIPAGEWGGDKDWGTAFKDERSYSICSYRVVISNNDDEYVTRESNS